jgi:hypothetical protein
MLRETGFVALTVVWALLVGLPAHAAEPSRQDAVRQLSPDVMPFDMARTTHVFSKTPTGGVQRVVAKAIDDSKQTERVRLHLRDLAARFQRRDFSGPSHVHGTEMPGLAQLRASAATDLHVKYREIPAGAEVEYRSGKPAIVDAIHQWFDAQLADHGADAMEGHEHSAHRE